MKRTKRLISTVLVATFLLVGGAIINIGDPPPQGFAIGDPPPQGIISVDEPNIGDPPPQG